MYFMLDKLLHTTECDTGAKSMQYILVERRMQMAASTPEDLGEQVMVR